jgi:FMN phosphatase YigB (HAD superfamily)
MAAPKKVIALFDVDGTLTPARKEVDPAVLAFLAVSVFVAFDISWSSLMVDRIRSYELR